MMTEQEIRAMRERLIQSKHDFYGGGCESYDMWVALMEQLNDILEIDTSDGPITGDGKQ